MVYSSLTKLPLSMYLTYRLNMNLPDRKSTDRFSTTFAALADPTRRAMLARLATGTATVTELAEPFDISLPAVSKHLKVLERAGLVLRDRDAQWRPSRLKADRLKDVSRWVERYRRFWDEKFDRLDEYLHELQRKEKKHGRKNQISRRAR